MKRKYRVRKEGTKWVIRTNNMWAKRIATFDTEDCAMIAWHMLEGGTL